MMTEVLFMQKTMPNAQRIVSNVCASMKMEGFSISAKTQQNCRAIASGEKKAADIVRERLAGYKRK